MSGLPLNHQLVSLGGRLVRACKTAPVYRMHSLGNRPALVRTPDATAGKAFEVEVWALPISNVGCVT
jgi:allophanate hydrolase